MTSTPDTLGSIVHVSTGTVLRGGERQALRLHTGLIERGYDSTFICRAGGACSQSGAAHCRPIAWRGEWDIGGLALLLHQCASIRPSIMHCHDAHALSHGALIGVLLGIPVIYTRRVIFPLKNAFFSRWKYFRCAALIAVSKAVALQCASVAEAGKIAIIPDGVDWNEPLLERAKARFALGVPESGLVIGTVGHFTKEKNLPLIVDLAGRILPIKPNVQIVCVGPLDGKPAAYPHNLVFAGYRSDALSLYSAFDVYVSASTLEGLGSALVDAVVRDIPAVAVNAGGTADIFPDAWPLIQPGDEEGFCNAVLQVIDDLPKAQAAAMQCGLRARELFSSDAMIEKTLLTYTRTVTRFFYP